MQKNSMGFSREELTRLAQDPAMQQLLNQLRSADSQALQSAATQASQGDLEGAKQTLSALLRQLGR